MQNDVWYDMVWYGMAYFVNLGIELQIDIFGIKILRLSEKVGVKNVKLQGTDFANFGLRNEAAYSCIICIGSRGYLGGRYSGGKIFAPWQGDEIGGS